MRLMGIDPDTHLSGVASGYDGDITFTGGMSFWEIIDELEYYSGLDEDFKVFIEAGWLNLKSNWHGGNPTVAAKIGKNIGANHMVGKLIHQYCVDNCIDCELVRPSMSKLSSEKFKKITGIKKRMNQDIRDAVMLIYGRR